MLHWQNLLIKSLKMIIQLVVRCFSLSETSNVNVIVKQAMLFDSPQHGT